MCLFLQRFPVTLTSMDQLFNPDGILDIELD